jgi:DNA primase
MAWFDFSSGKNGNIFDFVMATEGLSFPETVERLARDAGLELPARSAESERQDQHRAGLHEVLDLAADFFERHLRGERGARARAYLAGRGIAPELQSCFRLGYAPAERHALRDALAAKGASVETMIEAGLLIHGEDIPVPYDRFRDRVMFPIADRSGRVIAFGGRAMEKDVQAKYLNSPETPLFHKGAVLFNHHQARKAAHDKGRVIAVEGYVDVIAMHAAGFPETVAPLGTALTPDQAALLWGMAGEPILCFDGDKAGRKAAYRAADMALPLIGPNKTLRFALLPEGQDPDELLRAAGAGAVAEALDQTIPLVDLLWTRETETRPLATPEQRAGLERALAALAGAIADEPLRRHYKAAFDQRLARLFGAPERAEPRRMAGGVRRGGRFERDRFGAERHGYLSSPVRASASLLRSRTFRPTSATIPEREATILLLLIAHPSLIGGHAEDLAALDFAAKELGPLRDALLDLAQDDIPLSSGLRAALGHHGLDAIVAKLDQMAPATAWYAQPEAAADDADTVLRQALTLHRKARALHRELLSAEAALATGASEANFAHLRDIQEQLYELAGTEASLEGFGAPSGRPKPML